MAEFAGKTGPTPEYEDDLKPNYDYTMTIDCSINPMGAASEVARLRAEVARLRALLHRDRLVVLLQNEGLGDGGELCSWRCSDKDRYPGPCGCVDGLVDLITSGAVE